MKKAILGVFLIFLTGCAHMGTVKPQLNDKAFQAENLPDRVLSVCVISDGSWPEENIRAAVNDASNSLAVQVGIRLRTDRWVDHSLPSSSPTHALQNVADIIGEDHSKHDLVIGFSSRGLFSHLVETVFWIAWLGAIDDNYRKFIIIKFLNDRVLIHEISHAFVFSKDHGISGVLTAVPFKVPLLPILFNMPKYLSKEDRREFLKNKWRDFNEKPVVPEKYQTDKIEVPTP
ncbi:MAG: hypothetical protein EHM36_14870 [Deltaproteobacteria bacterium]|nr:MAG: hypothetical protein EHM36_14870 [Deltaproteobacteria bacterium]